MKFQESKISKFYKILTNSTWKTILSLSSKISQS